MVKIEGAPQPRLFPIRLLVTMNYPDADDLQRYEPTVLLQHRTCTKEPAAAGCTR